MNKSKLLVYGEVSEWLKELVLKTSEVKTSVGSNPTLSASSVMSNVLQTICDSKFNERLIHLVPVKLIV